MLSRSPSFRSISEHCRRRKSDVGEASSHKHSSNANSQDSSDHDSVHKKHPREPWTSGNAIWLGSYGRRSAQFKPSTAGSPLPSPRGSIGQAQLEHLLEDADAELETYGVEELRDGFFDAPFFRPPKPHMTRLSTGALAALPHYFKSHHPLSVRYFFHNLRDDLKSVLASLASARSSIKLTKSFLGLFIAYLICLIPASRDWLGRYNYILVLSTILNHPGRPIGSQIDGAFLTILGTAAGLGWGSLALYVSTATGPARSGYGGVLATFFIIFTGTIAYLRCVFIRLYQAALTGGIAICYTVLADTSESVGWRKIFNYGIPWALGQAIGLIVAFVVFPDTGERALASTFHDSFDLIQRTLILPRQEDPFIRRDLASTFVNLSQAVRDFRLEFGAGRLHPQDLAELRNQAQRVLRNVLAIKTQTQLFSHQDRGMDGISKDGEAIINIDGMSDGNPYPSLQRRPSEQGLELVKDTLAQPTRDLIDAMQDTVLGIDRFLMKIFGVGYRRMSHYESLPDARQLLNRLQASMSIFDDADDALVDHPELPPTYSDHPEVVELFLFVHPVRQAADSVQNLLYRIMDKQQQRTSWRIYLPSYPFMQGLDRTNAQVRHDRGGLTAGYYFRTKQQLDKMMADMQSTVYKPHPEEPVPEATSEDSGPRQLRRASTLGKYEEEKELETSKLRYQLWTVLHDLQGFETRFTLKVVVVTALLSVPAWLVQSRKWWNENEIWWVVVTAWLMMHPRVGGNMQDLLTRVFSALIGAIWAGLAWGAGHGNPYVLAVFCALFMLPMMYRFSQSSHPRSGVIGCISYTIISLSAYTLQGQPSVADIAWTRGCAFIIGVVAAVVVNWILWPFVARHELRKSVSAMLLYMSILYRGVVARYLYYHRGNEPGPKDFERSEMLESRLREGVVRMRQLMELTRHEIRLRGPFDPLPYNGLIDACERFFEHLVEVRESSLYFQPYNLHASDAANQILIPFRRDAVAAILMNLYILAGALREKRPVPRYLPSAAVARKRLLDRMEQVEQAERGNGKRAKPRRGRRWADVYQYAYSSALTDIVEQLQQLQVYTMAITGEVGFDPPESDTHE